MMRMVVFALLITTAASADSVSIGVLGQQRTTAHASRALDGARLAISDSARMLKLRAVDALLTARSVQDEAQAGEAARELAGQGAAFILADLDAPLLLAASDAVGERALLFNVSAMDDRLRRADCRRNVFHAVPSHRMLADALAQYLATRQWRRVLLVSGTALEDALYMDAIRASAARFALRIADDRRWTFRAGSGRADTGHVNLQSEIPAFTKGPDYDVLIVVDAASEFGEQLAWRTARPRPIAGTHGLRATGFDPANEQWGAAQIHARFESLVGRRVGEVEYAAWAAVRAIAEAIVRSDARAPPQLAAQLTAGDFMISGFKGRGLSFRPWDRQMRQPILLVGPRQLVSASPQPGFLHRRSELDTLGDDEEERLCAQPS